MDRNTIRRSIRQGISKYSTNRLEWATGVGCLVGVLGLVSVRVVCVDTQTQAKISESKALQNERRSRECPGGFEWNENCIKKVLHEKNAVVRNQIDYIQAESCLRLIQFHSNVQFGLVLQQFVLVSASPSLSFHSSIDLMDAVLVPCFFLNELSKPRRHGGGSYYSF